jgi:hypothetical protein
MGARQEHPPQVNDQYVEITTPYLDRHNDYTQIYVRKKTAALS